MIRGLEEFARSLGAELQAAQTATQHAWPGTRVASMTVELYTALERIGPGPRDFGLRVLSAAQAKKGPCQTLTIQLSGERSDDIEVRLNGKVFGRYKVDLHGTEK